MRKSGRTILNRKEIAVAALALVALAVFLFFQGRGEVGGVAHLSVRGAPVMEIPLSQAGDQIISLWEGYGVPAEIEIQDGRIRFVYVDCPDQICVNTGWIHQSGQSAVCLPNRAAIVIVGG